MTHDVRKIPVCWLDPKIDSEHVWSRHVKNMISTKCSIKIPSLGHVFFTCSKHICESVDVPCPPFMKTACFGDLWQAMAGCFPPPNHELAGDGNKTSAQESGFFTENVGFQKTCRCFRNTLIERKSSNSTCMCGCTLRRKNKTNISLLPNRPPTRIARSGPFLGERKVCPAALKGMIPWLGIRSVQKTKIGQHDRRGFRKSLRLGGSLTVLLGRTF